MKLYHTPDFAEYKMPLLVQTWTVGGDELESERVIDYARHSHRAWLAKHAHWAYSNERGLVTRPVALPYQPQKVTK